MGFKNAALTAGELTNMRSGAWYGEQYVALVPNTNVYTAQVSSVDTNPTFAKITMTGGVGTYADITYGMRVLISKSNDRTVAYFDGRVRKTGTTPDLYINETSAPIAANDYIFIIDDYPVANKMRRIAEDGTYYVDYDVTYRKTAPTETNLPSAVAGFVSGSVLTVEFDSVPQVIASGATISTYAWDVEDGTITVGTAASASITVTFPAGFRWVKLDITDSNSNIRRFRIPVWAFDVGTFDPETGFSGASITATPEDGYNATIQGFDGINTVLDKTLICIFSRQWYGGTETNINGTVDFVGRLKNERVSTKTDTKYGVIEQPTTFECEGVLSQIGRMRVNPIVMTNETTPAAWDEIKELTVWRAAAYTLNEDSTFTDLHTFWPSNTDLTFQVGIFGRNSDALRSAIAEAGESIFYQLEMCADGAVWFVPNGFYLTSSDRSLLVTTADFDDRDILGGFDLSGKYNDDVGYVEGFGGSYISATGETVEYMSIAPGTAGGDVNAEASLNGQILEAGGSIAQSRLNTRVANHLARLNSKWTLNVNLPDGYHFLTPSRAEWYTWDLPTTLNNRGRVFTSSNRWQLVSIQHTHNNETGRRDVSASFELEPGSETAITANYITAGAFTIPTFNYTTPQVPYYPQLPTYNGGGTSFQVADSIIHPSTDEAERMPISSGQPIGTPGAGPAPEWSKTFDFTGTSLPTGWHDGFNDWVVSSGYECDSNGIVRIWEESSDEFCYFLPRQARITAFSVQYSYSSAACPSPTGFVMRMRRRRVNVATGSEVDLAILETVTSSGTVLRFDDIGELTVDLLGVYEMEVIVSGCGTPPAAGDLVVTGVTLYGEGLSPYAS